MREGHSPYWTDYLYFPRHLAAPAHALAAQLAHARAVHHRPRRATRPSTCSCSLHLCALGLVLLAARAPRQRLHGPAGCCGGWSTASVPFHYFYLCQINVFSFEFLPLALLVLPEAPARGRRARPRAAWRSRWAGSGADARSTTSSTAYLAMAILLASARAAWSGGVPRALGRQARAPRLDGRRPVRGPALLAAALRLARARERMESGTAAFSVEKHRTNDLLGFYWIGPTRRASSPGRRCSDTRRSPWCCSAARTARLWHWLLAWARSSSCSSLGETLTVGGKDTGFPHAARAVRRAPRALDAAQVRPRLHDGPARRLPRARGLVVLARGAPRASTAVRRALTGVAGAVLALELGAHTARALPPHRAAVPERAAPRTDRSRA